MFAEQVSCYMYKAMYVLADVMRILRKKQIVKRLIAVPIINVDCLCHVGCWEREIIVKISNFKGQMLVNPYFTHHQLTLLTVVPISHL